MRQIPMPHPLQNLLWIEELLPPEVVPKRMHGGIGYYLDEKLVLILVESSKTREHKGITYPFELWQGCLFPIEKMKQNKVWSLFIFLENHPASKNWLYLPADSENIEEEVKLVIREIKKRNPLFGLFIKMSATESSDEEDIETTKPSLFNTGPVAKKKKILKKTAQKPKASKKSENAMMLSVLKRRIR